MWRLVLLLVLATALVGSFAASIDATLHSGHPEIKNLTPPLRNDYVAKYGKHFTLVKGRPIPAPYETDSHHKQ